MSKEPTITIDGVELKEAAIVINGIQLSHAQSMTVRVAVASMLMELSEPDHMKQLGPIGPIYQARLTEVQKLIFANMEQ